MNFEQEEVEKQSADYKVNVQMVTFVIIIMVVILTLVYFIRIYSNKKTRVLNEMKIEAILLETVIADNLNYSKYFIGLIGKNIRENPNNLEYIRETLHHHFQSPEFNMIFGWRKYSWVDKNFRELITTNGGIEENPRKINFMREIVDKTHLSKGKKDNIVFHISRSSHKVDTLKLIDAIFDEKTNQFIGAVILSYDIDTMIKSLNNNKKNRSINFVIIDKTFKVVAKSKPEIDKIVHKNDFLFPHLVKQLETGNGSEGANKDVSYLDMINGVNYFIKALDNLPFLVIINIDNAFIKNNIVETVTKKFLEVVFFAGICLLIIISIYRRETSLRTKAEKATILANNATRAKTNFLAFTAHEIRSPLGFILTGAEAMSKELFGPLPKNYIKYAEGIRSNGQLILDFIIDILDENQIIEGQFKIVNSLNNIEKIITHIVKSQLGKKNIEILTNFDEELPALICDQRRISQVIENLINNSLKYSEENTTIIISVKVHEERMIITISDEGMGMKEEEIPIALSRYGTLHRKDYEKGGSYGLGLPIVKMLLDAHDAVLDIQSVPGKGTVVKIIFPKYKMVYSKEKN